MKCATVPFSAVKFGWDAKVHIYAVEHGITIDSQEKYNQVQELISITGKIENYTTHKKKWESLLRSARRKRDMLKHALGYKHGGPK